MFTAKLCRQRHIRQGSRLATTRNPGFPPFNPINNPGKGRPFLFRNFQQGPGIPLLFGLGWKRFLGLEFWVPTSGDFPKVGTGPGKGTKARNGEGITQLVGIGPFPKFFPKKAGPQILPGKFWPNRGFFFTKGPRLIPGPRFPQEPFRGGLA